MNITQFTACHESTARIITVEKRPTCRYFDMVFIAARDVPESDSGSGNAGFRQFLQIRFRIRIRQIFDRILPD